MRRYYTCTTTLYENYALVADVPYMKCTHSFPRTAENIPRDYMNVGDHSTVQTALVFRLGRLSCSLWYLD